MSDYKNGASDERIESAKKGLENNNIEVLVVEDADEARQKVLELLPKGAEVLTATSQTLEKTGLNEAINASGDYDAVSPKLRAMWGDPSKKREQRKLGAAPDYIIGSVHAVTEDGQVLIASNTGSQLPGYSYAAGKVIWVVGSQKIVKDLDEAEVRLQQHVFPLENERAKKAYGGDGSHISKRLIVSREVNPDRVTIVIVKEPLGY